MRKSHPNFFPVASILPLLPLIFAVNSIAEEQSNSRWTPGVGFDFNSQYVWRGVASSDGSVFQPSIWCDYEPLTASFWGNFVLGREPNQGQFNEFDYSLQASHAIGGIGFTCVLSYYQYYHQENVPSTAVTDLTVSHQVGPFDLELLTSLDLGEYPGAYFGSFGIGHATDIINRKWYQQLTIGWGAAKFNETYFGITKHKILLIEYDASAQFEFSGFYLEPRISITYFPDRSLRDFINKSYLAVIGISITKELLQCK